MNKFNISQPYVPKTHVHQTKKPPIQTAGSLQNKFSQQLQDAISNQTPVKFSHHAEIRLKQNGIELSNEQLNRMNEGLKKAKEKGAKESLMLMDNLAFVISVKNETVITAMKQNGMNSQVVTNIDSAVIL